MTAESSAPGVDPRQYRDTIGLFASGVAVITTRLGDAIHGMTANALTSVSLEPTLLLICVDRRARAHDLILQAGVFAITILAEEQEALASHFAGRVKDGPPPASLRFVYGPTGDDGGVPTLGGAVVAIRCRVEATHAGGDHTIVIGRIAELRPGLPGTSPLLWFGGRYRRFADIAMPDTPTPEPPAAETWTTETEAEVASRHGPTT